MLMDAGLASISNSLYGLRRSLDGLRRESQTVAHGVVDGSTADLTGAMVRSAEHQRAAEANAAALKRAHKTMGAVIDILV
jgi:flagellar basal body rod protein FlgG